MITSNSPTSMPLTPLNNSPYSRGARAVHQGRKKAKADSEINSLNSNDLQATSLTIPKSLDETSPSRACDTLIASTPVSRGILKRKREVELEPESIIDSSKKKVIFANPISATKLIEARKNMRKTSRKRRLRYGDEPSEPEILEISYITNEPEASHTDDTKQDDTPEPEPCELGAFLISDTPAKDECIINQLEEPNIKNTDSELAEKTENNGDVSKDDIFNKIESLLQVIESPTVDIKSSFEDEFDPMDDVFVDCPTPESPPPVVESDVEMLVPSASIVIKRLTDEKIAEFTTTKSITTTTTTTTSTTTIETKKIKTETPASHNPIRTRLRSRIHNLCYGF